MIHLGLQTGLKNVCIKNRERERERVREKGKEKEKVSGK
jgi:hypothetical protein